MIPHCDLATGKIYGCKKGSWMWWHEKGHIEFNRLPSTSQLKLWQGVIMWAWMFSVTLSVVNKFMLVITIPTMIGYIGIDVYEERWCNSYANQKSTKKRNLYKPMLT